MDPCSCGKGAKAVYYCNEETCPNHKRRPTYCLFCNEQKLHKHASITVARETDRWGKEFIATEKEFASLFDNTKEKLSTYEPLIAMCERLTVVNTGHSLTSDWEVFKGLYL
jgi:hypothetical protein